MFLLDAKGRVGLVGSRRRQPEARRAARLRVRRPRAASRIRGSTGSGSTASNGSSARLRAKRGATTTNRERRAHWRLRVQFLSILPIDCSEPATFLARSAVTVRPASADGGFHRNPIHRARDAGVPSDRPAHRLGVTHPPPQRQREPIHSSVCPAQRGEHLSHPIPHHEQRVVAAIADARPDMPDVEPAATKSPKRTKRRVVKVAVVVPRLQERAVP